MMATLEDVERLTRTHRQKQAAADRSRQELHDAIRAALAAHITQAELVRVTGYTRETIRQIARNG